MPERILIVDDEKGIRTSLRGVLEDEGFEVDAVGSGERCLEVTRGSEYDLVLLDIWLPEMDGLAVLEHLKNEGYPAQVIMISGHGTIETAVRATRLGAWDFIEKPLSLEKTILLVRNALRQRRLERQNIELQEKLERREEMVGDSAAMQKLRQEIELAAPSESRVLIFGENGTGKELVARAVHRASRRAEKPFVEVNCAAIPEELIESEMFGHKKGSFTGASEDKEGKFKAADGGTLFLDEIGDMSLKTQAKVLRVLQEQKIEPVGSNETVKVDVRVIAATNKNLDEEIAAGRFRKDLYFRINVLPIRVPPLRERREDVPILARYFIEAFAARFGRRAKEIEPAAMAKLKNRDWPGNVRELANTIERLMIMVPDEKISVDDLDLSPSSAPAEAPIESMSFTSLKEAKEFVERRLILATLKKNEFNVAETAKQLQVERSHLYRKLRSYGIEIKTR